MLTLRGHQRGFSLLELMVVVALMGLMMALATPGLRAWSANAQTRAVSESWQSTLKMAQAEAVRSFRTVVLYRTGTSRCDGTDQAAATGQYYVIRTIAMFTGETAVANQCGSIGDVTSTAQLTGPAVICFGPSGRLTAVTTPGVGLPCTTGVNGEHIYQIDPGTNESSNLKQLQVWVTLGGTVRSCDRKRLSTAAMDGCPRIDASPTT